MRASRVEFVLGGAMLLVVCVFVAAVAGCSERRTRNYYITAPGPAPLPDAPDSCDARHCRHWRHWKDGKHKRPN